VITGGLWSDRQVHDGGPRHPITDPRDTQVRVESSHTRLLSLGGERGNHTNYFCELLGVTVRVIPGAMQGYVMP